MNRFKTLLLREWMQHQTGWFVVLALPTLLFVVAVLFGDVHVDADADGEALKGLAGPLLVALATIGGLALSTLALTWAAALLQAPGLARRDVQDRSIEFWLSLPTSHLQGLAAPLLMHLLLVPWIALGVGFAGGVVVSLPAVAKGFGIAAWFTLPWGQIAPAAIALALRVAVGLLLATLWLSPLILGTMAASAWLKRWGVPAVAAALGFGGLILDKGYGNPVVWRVLQTLSTNASQALIAADPRALGKPAQVADLLQAVPGWALHDIGSAFAALASPAFGAAIAAAAAAFALLWWRRQRGA